MCCETENLWQHELHCVTDGAPNSCSTISVVRQLNDQFDWAKSDLRNGRSVGKADCQPHRDSSGTVTKGRNNYQVCADYGRASQSVECLGPSGATAVQQDIASERLSQGQIRRQQVNRRDSVTADKLANKAVLTFVIRVDRLCFYAPVRLHCGHTATVNNSHNNITSLYSL